MANIHFFTETKKDGKWVTADKWTKDGKNFRVVSGCQLYSGQNYDLYALLGDFKNSFGIPGIQMGGIQPITPPKGFPKDACNELKKEIKKYGDPLNQSWYTVNELLTFDWTQTIRQVGWLNGHEYFRWKGFRQSKGEPPESYCGGIVSKDIVHTTVEDLDDRIQILMRAYDNARSLENAVQSELSKMYAKVEWEVPYYKACSDFWIDVLPKLLRLGPIESVRIIIWFTI